MATRTHTISNVLHNLDNSPSIGAQVYAYLKTPNGAPVVNLEGAVFFNGQQFDEETTTDGSGSYLLTVVYAGDLRDAITNVVTTCQIIVVEAGVETDSPIGYAHASNIVVSTWYASPSTAGTLPMILSGRNVGNAAAVGVPLYIDITVNAIKPDNSVYLAGQRQLFKTDNSGNIMANLSPTTGLNPATSSFILYFSNGQLWYFTVPTVPTGNQGAWNSGTTYHVNAGTQASPSDVVTVAGIRYQAVADSLNHTPPNVTYWQVWPGEPIDWHITQTAGAGELIWTAANIGASGTIPGALIGSPATVEDYLDNLLYVDKYGNLSTRTVSTTFTATNADDIIEVDATAANITGTVPTAIGQKKPIQIVKTDSSAHTVTINPAVGGQTFNGAASYILSTKDAGALFLSDGANYTIPSFPTADENVVTYTTTHTVLPAEDVIEADGTSSAWALNLPAAAGRVRPIRVILGPLATSAANTVTITPNGAETINNAPTLPLTELYGGVILNANTLGTGWDAFILSPASLTNPMNTVGDMIVGGASGVPTVVHASTNGFIWTLVGGTAVWAANGGGGGGSISYAWATKTANYTIVGADTNILMDCTGAVRTVTLPTAIGFTGRVSIKKKDGSANALSIATTSSQLIDGGAAPVSVTVQYTSYTFVSDNANWYVE